MKLPAELERAVNDEAYARELLERTKQAANSKAMRSGGTGDSLTALMDQFAANPDDLARLVSADDAELAGGTSWTVTITSTITAPTTFLTTALCALGTSTVLTMTTATLAAEEPEILPE